MEVLRTMNSKTTQKIITVSMIIVVAAVGFWAGYVFGDEDCCERHGGVSDMGVCKNLKEVQIYTCKDIYSSGENTDLLQLPPVIE